VVAKIGAPHKVQEQRRLLGP